MTNAEFMRKLRADAVRELEMVETVTRLLPDDILHRTLERRVALWSMIKEYDAALGRPGSTQGWRELNSLLHGCGSTLH